MPGEGGTPIAFVHPPITAEFIIVDDGTGAVTDGCEPIQNDLTGRIALIRRGACNFEYKALYAERAGAIAAVVMNNREDDVSPFVMGNGDWIYPAIPFTIINKADGDALEEAINAGEVVTGTIGAMETSDARLTSGINHRRWGDTDPDLSNDVDTRIVALRDTGGTPVGSFDIVVSGRTATFADTSTNEPTSWTWDFGDGNSSSDQNPTHAYEDYGSYTVSLPAQNDFGSDTASENIVLEFECSPIFVAAAGAGVGANSSAWSTDLGINNLGSDRISYKLQLLPRDEDNSARPMSDMMTLGANMSVAYADICRELASADGLAPARSRSMPSSSPLRESPWA